MSRFSYTEEEKKRNVVLAYQERECQELREVFDSSYLDESIESSEKLLKELGMPILTTKSPDVIRERKFVRLRDYDDIYNEAASNVGTEIVLEDLFTPEEIKANALEVKALNQEYNSIHKLDKYDVSIAVVAGLLGAIVDIVLIGIPEKGPNGLEAGALSNFIRKKFEEKFNPEEMEKLANSKAS